MKVSIDERDREKAAVEEEREDNPQVSHCSKLFSCQYRALTISVLCTAHTSLLFLSQTFLSADYATFVSIISFYRR